MNIGIFGGSFNPPHTGHLLVAEHAREQLNLAKVLFVPAATSPHKQGVDIVEAHHRLEMLECAVSGNRHFEVSDIEVQRGGVSFTVETLEELSRKYVEDKLVFLIGADNLLEFHTWREPGRILDLVEVVALTRPGFRVDTLESRYRKQITLCNVPEIGLESRQIRKRVKEGKSIRYMVPISVESYIVSHELYME